MAEIFPIKQRVCRDCGDPLAPLKGRGRPPVRCPECREAFLTPNRKHETGAWEPCLSGCGKQVFTRGRRAYCEACRPIALKAHQYAHRSVSRDRLTEYKLARGCENPDCDVVGPAYVLDTHHLDPAEKEFQIGCGGSWGRLLKELQKCVILCANCHRMVEAGDLELPPTLMSVEEYLEADLTNTAFGI